KRADDLFALAISGRRVERAGARLPGQVEEPTDFLGRNRSILVRHAVGQSELDGSKNQAVGQRYRTLDRSVVRNPGVVARNCRPGAMASAKSTIFDDGMRGTKISPPCIRSNERSTKSTPCCSVIQKRVMRSSVIGRNVAPSAITFLKNGTTEPRDPTTLP